MTFVSPHAVLGGAEAVLTTILAELGPAWVAGVVVLQDGPLVRELRRAGHEVTVLPTGPRGTMLVSALRLRAVLRRQRPALVHANGLKAALVAAAAVAATKTPLLWMKHDTAGDGRLAALVGARSDLVVGVSDTVLQTFAQARRPPRQVTVYNGVPERSVDRRAARALATDLLGLDADAGIAPDRVREGSRQIRRETRVRLRRHEGQARCDGDAGVGRTGGDARQPRGADPVRRSPEAAPP